MAELVFDLVVVGSGAAGLSAALKAAALGARVAVLSGGALLAGSSPRAQGGVAAALGADDGPALHSADTLAVGAGLNDAAAVDVLTHEGSRSLQELRAEGMPFADDLGLEAGHRRRRILHAGGGATGQVLTRALLDRACAHERIQLFANSPVCALQLADGRVVGARVAGPAVLGARAAWAAAPARLYRAAAVILATGGYAALWRRSTNAPETRGTGLALAWQAGASLADLEFVQFHPTALDLPGRPALLLSEALRGEGARLIDNNGHELVDPLLPRDVVARALYRHLHPAGGSSLPPRAYLSLRHLPPGPLLERFSGLAVKLREFGLDLARDLLPVAPAAHYCMGGIRTDTWGRTEVPGLYAAGEVACSGVQGANRLASNSLLECLVFGARAAEAALNAPSHSTDPRHTPVVRQLARSERASPQRTLRVEAMDAAALGARLDADLGVERDAARLQRLIADLPEPEHAQAPDLLLASLAARAAVLRTESRGAHFRTDAPNADPTWRGRIHWRRAQPPVFEEVLP